ncbi:structural maintenance of chromosomes protein 3, partial [Tanacetum coccineum]
GANGSGKSNFFSAIRFAISDLFHNLRNEDRHALLHEGAGHQVLSAFVEIVFDNSDNRIPVDKEEGKIASLTLMKETERLDLLKEIGGTRVYEERRRESLKIMQETGNKRNQIIQVVQYLDERLRELDEEKAELKKYQQLDKQRKSLEYTIYDKEVSEARRELAEVDDERNAISEELVRKYNSSVDDEEEVKKLDKLYKDLTREEKIIGKNPSSIAKDEAGKQLDVLRREIHESTAELNKIRPLYC